MSVPVHDAAKKTIVCAIDFGTSRSGYGYMLMDDDKILNEQSWDDMPESESFCKTLTQLLYDDKSNKPIAWGFSAPKRMAEIAEQAEMNGVELPPSKYALLRYFKMGLRNPTGMFQPNSHRSFKVVDIIADYLQLLWQRMESRLNQFLKRNVLTSEIKWCLTIPAIWTDAEKASMRTAAFKAGLIPKEDVSEDHFMLILEPEAAAAWCLEERKKVGTPLVDGESFLIVDAGGGTVDLTSHMLVGGKLKEVTIGTGGPCGSSEINAAFWKYFKEVICNNKVDLDAFRNESPLAELELINAFELLKCQVEDYSTIRNIRIPDPVASFLESLPQKPAAYIQKPTKMIRLTTPALQAIFEPIINAIDTLVSDQITANRVQGSKQFDYIFLVGGFGSSQLLFKHLKTKFSPLVHKVIQPANPGMAVISGAVLLGKDPSLIRTRRARATYGTASGVPFIAGTHDEKRKFTTEDGEEFCMDVFCKFVCVGDEIEVDKAVVDVFSPTHSNQTEMLIKLYTSPLKTPMYCNSPGVRQVGEISVDTSNTTGGLCRKVRVSMFFGRSEVKVVATEKISRKRYETSIKFE